MRFPRFAFLFALTLLAQLAFAPQTATVVQRDAHAIALLQQSVSAFGNTPPSDSTATGNVTIIAGSLTTQGTVSVLTKGNAETSIQFQVSNSNWSVIYSNGQANRVESYAVTVLPLELATSSQCLYFPLPYLAGLLSNPDVTLQFIGQETLGSASVNHIRAQNTFASTPTYQFLSDFTAADIWLDASSNALPVKIAMTRRDGGGSSPKIPISFAYSNYQTVSGVRYPFTIQEYVTETLWASTSIQSVSFNTGLTDANFPVTQGDN